MVGASFAGLACATAMARAGLRVVVLEKKADVGEKLHTTGIIVKEAIDQVALLNGLPIELVHRVSGVRLYAPNLRYADLAAPGYYFLATDTPGVMRWLAAKAEQRGVRIARRTPFVHARRIYGGFDLGELGTACYLVGADGPNSRVAQALGLGRNRQFLFGIEHEYAGPQIVDPNRMHCFIDRALEQVARAIEHEYEHTEKMETDGDLSPLHSDPRFPALFNEWRTRRADLN